MNYQKVLDSIICENKDKKKRPSLLLHACCAPCSSYVLEYLTAYFDITLLYYNPNISPLEEYQKRLKEVKRFLQEAPFASHVSILECTYDSRPFFSMAKGKEFQKEGEERCFLCYQLRLEETAKLAQEHHFDYFGTTLSISPYKKSDWLNEIGKELEEKYAISYLYSDFKKKNGYRRSIELSSMYHLYRQDYCGCIYSKREREKEKKEKMMIES